MDSSRVSLLGDLAAADASIHLTGDPHTRISRIEVDVRETGPGSLFVAIPGKPFSDPEYASEAVARGAAAILANRELGSGLPEMVAPRLRPSIAKVSAAHFGHPSSELDVIGITGTDGKTTTTYLVDSIFRATGQVGGHLSTVSLRIGDDIYPKPAHLTTPDSPYIHKVLRQIADIGGSWAVLEATSHGLQARRLDEIRLRVGAITNITPEHLEHHVKMSDYQRAKGILFELVAQGGGTAVINADDSGAREMLRFVGGSRVVHYGIDTPSADVRATNIHLTPEGTEFDLIMPGCAARRVRLPLPGLFNLSNALCAASVAIASDVPVDAIVEGLKAALAPAGRMRRIDLGQPFAVYVDFAHTTHGVETVLKHLRTVHSGGRIILVIGGAGDSTLALPKFGEISARFADFGVFTTDNPNEQDPALLVSTIAEGAEKAGAEIGTSFTCTTDRRNAIFHAISIAGPGDAVLLAGIGPSRSLRWDDVLIPWDEAAVATEALQILGFGGAVAGSESRRFSLPGTGDPMTPTGDGFALTISNVFHAPIAILPHRPQSPDVRSILVAGTVASPDGIDAALALSPDLTSQADLTLIDRRVTPPAGSAKSKHMSIHDIRGLRIGTLTCCEVSQACDRARTVEQISRSRPLVDLLIVSFDWGRQAGSVPETPSGSNQDDPREIAHLAVESGADLVLGNSAHWVQGIEFYMGKLIAYSHGSFLPDHSAPGETAQGVIGRYMFHRTRLIRVEYLPLVFDDQERPRQATGEARNSTLKRMEGSSIILALPL
jgi:UDP-N-acetylmuramoyl-L-alanyl-D-glutamate--2,6-diaminopimelate ligase